MMSNAIKRETRKQTPHTPAVPSGRWLLDPRASHARFLAGTLGGLVKTPGRFRSLSGHLIVDEGYAAGSLVIDSSSIDTGNRIRDRHLRSRHFFHAELHPQVRYHVHSISQQEPGRARVDGVLMVANACMRLPLEVTLQARPDGLVELTCHTEVDRLALGIRGARGMVPRAVRLDVAITLRRASA
jgi:polyisoprenoid-binding protein YceI